MRRQTIDRIWARDPAYKAIWIATTPVAVAYSAILAVRALWWQRLARTPPLPTISVGNLTVGGNAKTPFALFLAGRLRQKGLRIGLVSRGYGGRRSGRAALVSDGKRLFMSAREAGDEPVMLARSFNGPVAVARRRIGALQLLARSRLVDAAVLDDGFQHLRLRRDLNLLLFNKAHGVGNGWVLPAGPMREPLSAIVRADAVVLVGTSTGADDARGLKNLSQAKLVLHARLQPSALIQSQNGQWQLAVADGLAALKSRRVVAVSGLANPCGFHSMLRELGANLVHILDYPDHRDYRRQDWQNILRAAERGEMLITTEKDLVKLEAFLNSEIPTYALRLKLTMDEQEEAQLIALAMDRIEQAQEALQNRSRSARGGNR